MGWYRFCRAALARTREHAACAAQGQAAFAAQGGGQRARGCKKRDGQGASRRFRAFPGRFPGVFRAFSGRFRAFSGKILKKAAERLAKRKNGCTLKIAPKNGAGSFQPKAPDAGREKKPEKTAKRLAKGKRRVTLINRRFSRGRRQGSLETEQRNGMRSVIKRNDG